jgi:hypothetical protein
MEQKPSRAVDNHSASQEIRSRGSSVNIVSGYGLDDRVIGARSPTGAEDFFSNFCVQTGSEAHPAFCTMGTGGPFLGAKRGRGVTLTTHPILCRGQEWVGAILPLLSSAFVACSGTALLCQEITRSYITVFTTAGHRTLSWSRCTY